MNRGAKRPSLQHFLPKMHLNRFVADQPRGMVWVYDRRFRQPRPQNPAKLARVRNLYTVPTEAGLNDSLEAWLGDVESKASPIYARLTEGIIPKGQGRADFSTFLASLYCRNPRLIQHMGKMRGFAAQQTIGILWDTRERFDAFVEAREREGLFPGDLDRDHLWAFFNDPSRYYITVDQTRGMLDAMLMSATLQRIFFEMHWTVLFSYMEDFVTSDCPVFRFQPTPAHPVLGDGGFMGSKVEVTFPLAPHAMLLLTRQDALSDKLPVPPNIVQDLNRRTAATATNWLVARTRNQDLEWFFELEPELREFEGVVPAAEVRVRRTTTDKD